MPDFHNPYNFIPNPDRNALEGTVFGDSEPRGHSALSENTYRGVVRVNATAQTPLFVPDAARSSSECLTHRLRGCPANERDCKRHETLPLRLVRTSPHIPPSSVKGMLRSAYEAATLSRYGVMAEPNGLGYRPSAAVNPELIPFRVVAEEKSKVVLQLFWGADEQAEGVPAAAWVAMSAAHDAGHGKNVPAELQRYVYTKQVRGRRRTLRFYAVTKIGDTEIQQPAPNGANPEGDSIETKGWIHATARNPNQPNFQAGRLRKHHERFFFDLGEALTVEFDDAAGNLLATWIRRRWAALIADYQEVGRTAAGASRVRGKYQTGWAKLEEGTQGYAVIVNGEVVDVQPVIKSRRLYTSSPFDLARRQRMEPASAVDRLSMADRVLGWVSQKGAGSDVTSAVKGKVSIGPVETAQVQLPDSGVEKTLAILSTPRPSYGRFYTGTADGAPWEEGGTKEETSYDAPGARLRGRKVYPHQHNPAYAINAAVATGAKAKQNKTMQGWIKKGSTFAFGIRIEGLNAVELGALLWTIRPNDDFYHKLGAAKPFGYGSVALEIDNEVTRIESAADVRRCWLAEDPVPPELPDFVQEYKDALISATNVAKFESHPTIAAFLQYGAGLHGVGRYPGANDRNEPGFKWFVENERGPRHSLPEIGGTLPDL